MNSNQLSKSNKKIISTLFKKEILDVLRDKKTVIMMLVVPVILYPLIFIVALQVMSSVTSSIEKHTYNIAVSKEDDLQLYNMLKKYEAEDEAGNEAKDAAEKNNLEGQSDEASEYSVSLIDADSIQDYEGLLQKEEIDVYVKSYIENDKVKYDIYYLSSVTNSDYAAGIVYDVLGDLSLDITKEKIDAAGLDVDSVLKPISYVKKDIASSEQSMGSILGTILPFMLIISLMMGTMYPAIDTTAGERERGTLETLLTLPITNRQLIIGKFFAVALIGIASAVLNLLSMGAIGIYLFKVMKAYGNANIGIQISSFIPAIVISIFAILAFSLFVSAITMCVTAFAKTYKEANNYITPLMLVILFTGYIGFIPNIALDKTMAIIPVANICLLIKNLLLFKIDYAIVALVLLSNVAYAAFAILFLSKIYDSESILFGDGKGSIQIFEKRSNMKKGGVPSSGDAWFVMMFTIVLVIYIGGMLQVKYGMGGVFFTQLIIFLVPFLMVLYTKKDIKKTYYFNRAKLSGYVGGVILVIGSLLFGMLLSAFMSMIFPDSSREISESFDAIYDCGFVISFLVVAVTPAICEEMMFRGYIFSAMRSRYKDISAILIVAAAFGMYHMSMVKFLTTGFLGAMLCYTVYATGSIFPAMLMHFINNGLSVVSYFYPEKLGRVMPFLLKEEFSRIDILIIALVSAVLIFAGIAILNRQRTRKNGKEHENEKKKTSSND